MRLEISRGVSAVGKGQSVEDQAWGTWGKRGGLGIAALKEHPRPHKRKDDLIGKAENSPTSTRKRREEKWVVL